MDCDKYALKKETDNLYEKLQKSAATFILKPHEIEEIRERIFELQDKCNHEFVNGKCIYCRKEE